jgi:hypothetical protein
MADSKLLPAYDWSGYFLDDVHGDPLFRALAESPCEDFDRKSREFFENKVAVLAAISEAEGTSFLLIPTKGKKVAVLHSLFVVDPTERKTIVVGTMGTRRNSPFKAVLVSQVIKPMTSSKPGHIVLPGGFDDVKTADDFRRLKGNKVTGSAGGGTLQNPLLFFPPPELLPDLQRNGGPSRPSRVCNKDHPALRCWS